MITIEKPWGYEEIIEINSGYMMKRLKMTAGHRCSLQYHNIKRETIYVLSGKLRILFGDSVKSLSEKIFEQSESITIQPGCIHRMEAITDAVYLEASLPDDGKDVIRISDDYQRDVQ